MKFIAALLLTSLAMLCAFFGAALGLLKLDLLTGSFADFNTFLFSGACLGVAVLLALAAWWLTEEGQ